MPHISPELPHTLVLQRNERCIHVQRRARKIQGNPGPLDAPGVVVAARRRTRRRPTMALSTSTTTPGRPVTLGDVFARRMAHRERAEDDARGEMTPVSGVPSASIPDAGAVRVSAMPTTIGAVMMARGTDGGAPRAPHGSGAKATSGEKRRASSGGGISTPATPSERRKSTSTPSKTRTTRTGAVSARTRLAFNAVLSIDGKKSAQKGTVRSTPSASVKVNSGKNSLGTARGGVAGAREPVKKNVDKNMWRVGQKRPTTMAGRLALKIELEKRVNARIEQEARRAARQIGVNPTSTISKPKKKLLAPSGELASVENTPRRDSTRPMTVNPDGARAGPSGRAAAEPEGERVSLPRESRRHATAFEDNPRYSPSTIRVKLPSLIGEPAPEEWLSQQRLLELCREGAFIDVRVSSLTSATLHAVKNAVRKDVRTMKGRFDTPFIRVQVLEHYEDASGWVVTTVRVLPEVLRHYRLALTPTSGKGLVQLVFNLCEEAAYGCLRLFKLKPNVDKKKKRTRDGGTASPSTLDSEVVVRQPGTPPRARAASQARKKLKPAGSSDPDTQTPPDAVPENEANYGLPQSVRKDNPTPSSTNGGLAEDGSPTESPTGTTSSHGATLDDMDDDHSMGGVLKISDSFMPSQVRTITEDGVELPPMTYAQQQALLEKRQQRQQLQQQLQQRQEALRQQQAADEHLMSPVPEVLYNNVADYYSRLMPRSHSGVAEGDVRPADRARLEGMFLNDTYSPRPTSALPSISQLQQQHRHHHQQHQQQHHHQQQQQQQQMAQQQLLARQQMPPPVSIPVQRISNPVVYYLPVPISPQSAPGTVTHAVLGGMRVRVIVESVDQPQSPMVPSRDAEPAQHYRQVREPDTASLARARPSKPSSGNRKTARRRQEDDDDMVAANLLMLKTSMPAKKSSKSKSSKPSSSKPPKKMANLSMF